MSSNYARQVFRGNAAIVQKLATQFELYGLLLLVKEKNLSFGRTWWGKMKVKFICNRLREKTLFPLVNKQCSKSSSTNQLSRSGEVTNSLVACFCARCQWREKFWKSGFTKWPELGMYLPSQVRTQNASRVLQKWTKIIWNLRAITTTNTQTVKDLTEGEKQKNAKS